LLGCALLSGCSYASTRGRQQMAYARYVKKFSHKRVKQQTKFKKWKMPFTPQSQQNVNTSVGGGPESASSISGN
jgi:hypothetical protein